MWKARSHILPSSKHVSHSSMASSFSPDLQISQMATDALATADGAWLYPVQEGIPILLSPEAIPGESAETP